MSQAPSGPQGKAGKLSLCTRLSNGIRTAIGKVRGGAPDEKPALFNHVIEKELEEIIQRREKFGYESVTGGEKDSLVGLALSGGGIRSATVCLGALQALNKLD